MSCTDPEVLGGLRPSIDYGPALNQAHVGIAAAHWVFTQLGVEKGPNQWTAMAELADAVAEQMLDRPAPGRDHIILPVVLAVTRTD